MATANTERSDERHAGLDRAPLSFAVAAMLDVQQAALRAVAPAVPALTAAIAMLADRLRAGGRMAYAGAGSSGLIAQLDAIELPGTFGIAPDRVPVILAGGVPALRAIPSGAEDEVDAAEAEVDGLALGPGDALIAVAASGTTPFTLAALRQARRRGAATVGLACVAGSPLLTESDHPILIETPPEAIAGSTRMGAGTAQKCALNILSSGVGLALGHVYAGRMVNMRPENAKLRGRAVGIVRDAAGVDAERAESALAAAGWSIKPAIVACLGAIDAATAQARLDAAGGIIPAALARSVGGLQTDPELGTPCRNEGRRQ